MDADRVAPSQPSRSSFPTLELREPGRTTLIVTVVEPLEVGRACSGLLITDPEASRRHLVLRPQGSTIVIDDIGSSNGTTIDGQPLTGPTTLAAGQLLQLGSTTIRLLSEETEPRSPAPPRPGERSTSIDLVAAAAIADAHRIGDHQPSRDSGTVTIVFSDIEGSTQQSVTMGDDQWMDLLNVHNRIVRHHVDQHHGTEVKAQGDGFMLTFPSARAAAQAMIELQRSLSTHARSNPMSALRVRVGIHTGEAIIGDRGDLFGRHVVMAARIANQAVGGEILVSSLVREIIDSRTDLHFGQPRGVELKGLTGTHTVHPLLWSTDT